MIGWVIKDVQAETYITLGQSSAAEVKWKCNIKEKSKRHRVSNCGTEELVLARPELWVLNHWGGWQHWVDLKEWCNSCIPKCQYLQDVRNQTFVNHFIRMRSIYSQLEKWVKLPEASGALWRALSQSCSQRGEDYKVTGTEGGCSLGSSWPVHGMWDPQVSMHPNSGHEGADGLMRAGDQIQAASGGMCHPRRPCEFICFWALHPQRSTSTAIGRVQPVPPSSMPWLEPNDSCAYRELAFMRRRSEKPCRNCQCYLNLNVPHCTSFWM